MVKKKTIKKSQHTTNLREEIIKAKHKSKITINFDLIDDDFDDVTEREWQTIKTTHHHLV